MWFKNKETDYKFEIVDEYWIAQTQKLKFMEVIDEPKLEQPEEVQEHDNFYCEECDREFKNASGLSAHNRSKHRSDEE